MPSSVFTARPACLLGRYSFPSDWSVLLVIPFFGNRYNGAAENNIFQTHCPISKIDVERVSHLVFMNLIPFLIEHDIEAFWCTLDHIQTIGFNKVELTLQPHELTELMNNMRDAGAYGVGLSSFGPTLFTIYDRENKDIVDATRSLLGDDGIVITTVGQNSGAKLF
ncbi:MAG TPA: hypothetical protein O0W88_03355 [Methanocorpusculum sp.]|nr:hypothetical protein [Methanocorpusculum sp.]